MPRIVTGDQIGEAAKKALGTNYVYGGNDLMKGVDCSGLVQQVFKQFGINVPRVTYEQIGMGANVPRNKLLPGDLVFFDTDRKKSGPDHVGIYLGGGKFIHAPRTGQKVKISSLADSYYMDRFMAARRIPGVAGGAGLVGYVEADTFGGTSEEVRKSKAELAETYGFSMAFFNSVPELKKLMNKAVDGQWDATLFQARLKNTKWWKTTSSTNRQAQVMQKQDPATYKANIEAARVAAQQLAVKMGATLSGANIAKLAKNIVHFGWNDAQIQNFMGQYIKFNEKYVLGGQAGAIYQQLRTVAYDNGVRMSEQQIKNSTAYVVRGVSTMEKEQMNIRAQAAGAFPAFADQVTAGFNMRDIAQPYIQAMAQTLEIPDTDVDLYTPKIKEALNRMDSKGQPAPMSLTDFQLALKDDPAWRRTSTAQGTTFAIGRQVLQDMGLVPRG